MASKNLGQLTVDLVANIGAFTGPLDKAQREADKKAKEFARTQKANERAVANTLTALDKQVEVLGKTAKEQKLMELRTRGATEAQLAQAAAAYDAIEAFDKKQEAIRKSNESLQDNIKFAKSAGVAISAAFVAAGGAVAANVVHVVNSAKEIENLSRVANESAENFQRIAYAAKPFGVEQEKLADILKDVNDKVGDFLTTGQGPLADFFEKIAPQVGVTAEQFRNLSGSDALGLYIKSLEEAGVSQAEMTFFMEAIASDATLLLPLFKENARELGRLTTEFDKFGGALTDVDIAQLKEADEAFRKLSAQGRALSQDIAVAALPAVRDFIELLSDPQTIENLETFGSAVVRAFTAATKAITTTVGVIEYLAEATAASIHGPAIDDTVRLGDALDSVNEKIAQLEVRLSSRKINRGHWEKQLEEMRAERERLQMLLDLSKEVEAPRSAAARIASADDMSEFPKMSDPFASDFGNGYEKLTEDAKKYLDALDKQKTLSAETTELAKVNFEIQSGSLKGLMGSQKEALLNRAAEIDQLKAQQKETEELAKIQQASADYIASVQQQIALLDAETEAERVLYEVQFGRYAMLDQTQKDAMLRQAQMLDDARAQIEAEREYKQLIADVMTEEEKRTEQLRERLAVIDAMDEVSFQEKEQVFGRVIKTSFDTDPDKPEAEGFDVQREALQSWYDEQLEMLEQFRAERADLNAQWDEQEAATRSEYEQRLTDINARAEEQRREQLANGYSALLDVAGKYYDGVEGEEAAYARAALQLGKTLLDEKTRDALKSIIANTHSAAMGAYASLSPIPFVGPALGAAAAAGIYVAGGAAAAAVTGIAHEGIDSVPQTGTWFLEAGERVTTAETSAKLDSTLDDVQMAMSGEGNGGANVRIVNNIDPEIFGEFMGSARGEKIIMNTISRNQRAIKTIAGS